MIYMSASCVLTHPLLQGAPSSEELEALDHWRGLLAAVLDLQDQQRQQDAAAGAADGGGSSQQEGQQQRAVKQKGGSSNRVAAAEANGSDQLEQQGQQQQRMGKQKGGGGGGGAAAGAVQEKLLLWLQQPDSRRHYLRVVLECLRELAAVEIPARVLMQHQVGLWQISLGLQTIQRLGDKAKAHSISVGASVQADLSDIGAVSGVLLGVTPLLLL